MSKALFAVLAVLATASAAFAAYPSNHPCVATQKLDPVTGVVTTVAPDQRTASAAGGVTKVASDDKAVARSIGVSSVDPASCSPSYFGAQDADRRINPESGGGGDSGSAGAGAAD